MANLPIPAFDERAAITIIAEQVALVLPRMNASHENLAGMLRDCLRRGDLSITLKAIEYAERKGDWLADSVLRATYVEMKHLREPLPKYLEEFGEKAVLRAPVTRGRGRDEYHNWSRDIGICCLVEWTCTAFKVRPTRTRSARRERTQSGISLVKQALERHKIHLEEKTIQDNIWLGLPGMLARQAGGEFGRFPG